MSLKKKAAFAGFGVLWALCSFFTFLFLADASIKERDLLDKTRARRITWVLSGPGFWILILTFATLNGFIEYIQRIKKTFKPMNQLVKDFFYYPPRNRS